MDHPVVPVKTYLTIFGALMVLTALTVWVAFIDFGHGLLNDTVAMSIAVLKALLVLVIFMHLKYSAKILWLIAGSSVIWMIIMIGLTLTDYRSREWIESQAHRAIPWASNPPIEQPAPVADDGHH
ncbi:MAG TPA: cytochrome C oxidase subunit IV family protein [Kiritimatiellia bacterium]|nr:cytochrome C oxidase subunit IV family protein [Kiritimatiellia bacterium]HMP35069.1 cytochrome C oxidase subunit IV family protein [Kiritimatiellia bacterium]